MDSATSHHIYILSEVVTPMRVLVSTIFSAEPTILAATRFSPDRIIALVSEEPTEDQKKAVELVKGSLGSVLEFSTRKIPMYDVVKTAGLVVSMIDTLSSEDELIFNVTSGRKTQSMGVLFGAYARASRVRKIVYLADDKKTVVHLPILSFSFNETEKALLEAIGDGNFENTAALAEAIDRSPAMVYRALDELKRQDYVEVTDDGFRLTDAGRIARL
jgi:CRISPR-associated protein Csa3